MEKPAPLGLCVEDNDEALPEKGFSRDKRRLLRLLEFDRSILDVMCVLVTAQSPRINMKGEVVLWLICSVVK